MKFRCLVIDHDDTAVDSTATIHFPCFVEYLAQMNHPLRDSYTLDSYFLKNFEPGISALLRDEIGLNEVQVCQEERYWADYVEHHIPNAYRGIKEILDRFKSLGGILVVDSHSYTRYIERDYVYNRLPTPDRIYGWDIPAENRKPSPYTVLEVIKDYKIDRDEVLVLDDLKPGYDMARAAGVKFACAGWAHNLAEIESFMKQRCDYYLKTVDELEKLLFES